MPAVTAAQQEKADGQAPAATAAASATSRGRLGLTVAALSVRPVARSMRWPPLAGASAGGLVLLWLLRPDGGDSAGTIAGLRLGAYLLAAGAAVATDDRAAAMLAPSPTPLSRRRALRLVVTLAPLSLAWCTLLVAAWAWRGAAAPVLPAAALTIEAVAMLAFTVAVATIAAPRSPDGLGGVAGPPALTLSVLTLVIAQMRWPQHLTMFPMGPDDPVWTLAHQRWAVVALVAAATLVATSVDPAWRPPHIGLRRTR